MRMRFWMAAAAIATLAGCDQIGNPIEMVAGEKPKPDEFRVLPRKPLVVPEALANASASLPQPEPGRPSPLAPSPSDEAVVALLGPGAASRPTAIASLSAGETALLSSASATTQTDIRIQLEADREEAEQLAAEGPYEPPTVLELIGLSGDDEDEIDPEIALDPVTESQRLQRDGLPTPFDPLAQAPDDGDGRPPSDVGTGQRVVPFYDSTTDRRPQNAIQQPGTGPAFE